LRCLAGFVAPDSGRVFFGDEEVTGLPAHKRNTGMMFQSYALWPHLSVEENVAFGLEERRVARPEIRRRVGEALDSVHMGAFAARRPGQLSGGQQQRVALARALVVRPRCLLLDEPLSNLDARLRLEMRAEIRRVSKEFKLTTVYVTHDQKEALSISDRIAILEGGRILQIGTPREVYRRPASRTVADFMGETGFFSGRVLSAAGGRAVVETPLGRFEGVLVGGAPPRTGAAATLSIRPECWTLGPAPAGANSVPGATGDAVFLGEVAQYEFRAAAASFKVIELNPGSAAAAGRGGLFASVDPEDVVILPG
jgi:iron(III) transport system ATP-binding protein